MSILKFLFVAIFATVVTFASAQKARRRCVSQAKLICVLKPTTGNSVSGTVVFSPIFKRGECNVRINADLRGLSPGQHGWHIHRYGDISADDGSSLGSHFPNPKLRDVPHGFPDSPVRHWGDFGNFRARSNGRAKFTNVDKIITLPGIVGRGIIIHADPDLGPDFQDSGNSGARQASCVIGFAAPGAR